MSVMTVRGPVPAGELGMCMPHEHVVIDLWTNAQWRWDLDGVLIEEDIQTEEMRLFKAAGGGTIVDLTLPRIGRNPEMLKSISIASDVHIVMGCGWYREPYYPPEIDRTTTDELAAELIAEIEDGVGPEKIKPGIIGEIGSHKSFVTAKEERVFRAAARAQLATGLSVTTHSVASPVGLEHLKIFLTEGVSPERIVIGHCDSYVVESYLLGILEAGASVMFDNIGYADYESSVLEPRLIRMILDLIGRGYANRILLSQDVCKRPTLAAYGGPGYQDLLSRFHGVLAGAGVSEADWTLMTVENPARMLERATV
jgi:predicted metal-dependent phosphotriesterase family hydrolase